MYFLYYQPLPRTILLQNHPLGWNWQNLSSSLVFQPQGLQFPLLTCLLVISVLRCVIRETQKRIFWLSSKLFYFHGQVMHGIILLAPKEATTEYWFLGVISHLQNNRKLSLRGKGCLRGFIPICQLSSSDGTK